MPTLQASPLFAPGSSVALYPRTAWGAAVQALSGAPSGAATQSGLTVGTDGKVSLNPNLLVPGTTYVLYQSPDRYLRYTEPAADAAFAVDAAAFGRRVPRMALPVIAGGRPVPDSTVTQTALQLRYALGIMPEDGYLRDFTITIGAATSGNLIAAIYDTGDASSGNRTKLWDSGSVAAGAINTEQVVGDPNLFLKAGTHFVFAVAADNATVQIGRVAFPVTGLAALAGSHAPTSPSGAPFKLGGSVSAAGSLTAAVPATIAETSMGTGQPNVPHAFCWITK